MCSKFFSVMSYFGKLLWTVAHQAHLSPGKNIERVAMLSPQDLPDAGIEPAARSSCIVGRFFDKEPAGQHVTNT